MAALVIGGANGIGLAIASLLSEQCDVIVADRVEPAAKLPRTRFMRLDLTDSSYGVLESVKQEVDTLVITAGFGRLALFQDIKDEEIVRQMTVNAIAPMRIIGMFYDRILSPQPFHTAVMVSISGFMASPFFSTYGASKAALNVFISSLNAELTRGGTGNRILNVSPGSFKGSRFNGGASTDITALTPLATEIISHMKAGETLFIPLYEEVYKEVLRRSHENPEQEALHSYDYKAERIRQTQNEK